MSADKKFKYHFYLNEKEFYEKTFSLEEIENGEFLNFKKNLLNKYNKEEKDLIIQKFESTNLFINFIQNDENEIYEDEIVYSKKLEDFAIVNYHSNLGGWVVLFEEIGHHKFLFLYIDTNDLIKVGTYIEMNGSNNYDELCEKFLLKIEKND